MPDGPALSLHPLLARRWSPTTFDPAEEVSEDAVEILLEAARWADARRGRRPRRPPRWL